MANRLVSAALLPITIAPFAAGSLSPLLDGTFIGLIIVHTYIGFQYVLDSTHPRATQPKMHLLTRCVEQVSDSRLPSKMARTILAQGR